MGLVGLVLGAAAGCIADPNSIAYEGTDRGGRDADSDVGGGDIGAGDEDVGQDVEDASPGGGDTGGDTSGDTSGDTGGEEPDAADSGDGGEEIPPGPYASCAELRRYRPDTPDGVYTIDTGTGELVEVYCDMTTDGGAGYTMKRIDNNKLGKEQAAYRAACAAVGMEVIVPRTRAHAMAIYRFNGNALPNLVNVFPTFAGASGLSSWEGRCQGQPCTFYLSDTNSSNCGQHLEPNGDNSPEFSLYLTSRDMENGDLRCYGRWNDHHEDRIEHREFVICSTNDATPPVLESCEAYRDRDQVHNAGPAGISGLYEIDDGQGRRSIYCDMTGGPRGD